MRSQWLKDETVKQGCPVDYAERLLASSPKPGQMTLYVGKQSGGRRVI